MVGLLDSHPEPEPVQIDLGRTRCHLECMGQTGSLLRCVHCTLEHHRRTVPSVMTDKDRDANWVALVL
jgi:hypothetical protein